MDVLSFPSAAYLKNAGNVKEIKRANNNFVEIKNLLELQPTTERNEPSALILISMLIRPLVESYQMRSARISFPVQSSHEVRLDSGGCNSACHLTDSGSK